MAFPVVGFVLAGFLDLEINRRSHFLNNLPQSLMDLEGGRQFVLYSAQSLHYQFKKPLVC
jgi:hypothetical protein